MKCFYGGILSQWFPSKFTIDGNQFNCAEQYMMLKKAELFTDNAAAQLIMSTTDPSEQKAIGRRIRNYSDMQWIMIARDVVFSANMAKFTQDKTLRRFLLGTGEEELVEASPTDQRWGIGLSMNDPDRFDRTKWQGFNWLGEVLMRVRKCLQTS